jgi:hypothetical protein
MKGIIESTVIELDFSIKKKQMDNFFKALDVDLDNQDQAASRSTVVL